MHVELGSYRHMGANLYQTSVFHPYYLYIKIKINKSKNLGINFLSNVEPGLIFLEILKKLWHISQMLII